MIASTFGWGPSCEPPPGFPPTWVVVHMTYRSYVYLAREETMQAVDKTNTYTSIHTKESEGVSFNLNNYPSEYNKDAFHAFEIKVDSNGRTVATLFLKWGADNVDIASLRKVADDLEAAQKENNK